VRVRKAWYVLSDPIRLDQFEREIREEENGFSSTSFWTMCPYCWYLTSVRESMKIVHFGVKIVKGSCIWLNMNDTSKGKILTDVLW
jgi:hypothetical protein